MNLIIDITISKEFSQEEINEIYKGNAELLRRAEKDALKDLLGDMLDDGYNIVLNTTMQNS